MLWDVASKCKDFVRSWRNLWKHWPWLHLWVMSCRLVKRIALGTELPSRLSFFIPREGLQLLGLFVYSLVVGQARSFSIHSFTLECVWSVLRDTEKGESTCCSTVPTQIFPCLSCAQSGLQGCYQRSPCLQPALLQLRRWPLFKVIHFSPGLPAYILCEMQSFLARECLKLAFSPQNSGFFLRSPYGVLYIHPLAFFSNIHQDFSCILSPAQLGA